ncbi:MAG: hypothetical protein PUB89_02900 [Oscillospiraceae bacterium]|nr:hypothetical protein [Oscillospiraceae bacterium]
MKFLEKMMAFAVSVTMCLTLCCNTFAYADSNISANNSITTEDVVFAETNLFPDLETNLVSTPEALGLTNENVRNIAIGEAFTIVDYVNGSVDEVSDILYFPVISNENIIALLTLMKYNGELSASIGRDFADELSSYLKTNKDNVALFAYNQDIMGINSDSEIHVIFDTYEDSLISSKDRSLANISYNEIAKEYNVISDSNIYESSVAIDTVSLSATTPTDKTRNSSRSYNFLINYPIVYQGNYGICWAATVAAMVIYEVDSITNLTATEVCDAIGHTYTGGNVYDVLSALNYYLPSNYLPNPSDVLSKDQIKAAINSDNPAYMSCYDINNSDNRHAVSLCGYSETSNTFQIRIMDSAYQCFKFSTYSSTNGYLFAFGNTQYKWDYTVNLFYN